ncbi:MAG: class I SAM-dependent methyltransferase [Proteobacteria bacterium]|nr:class I SAM-dependent methyltransferase [Pseudomonadota bacterium]
MDLCPNNPERWERIWDYAQERSPLKKRLIRSEQDRITRWDRMAEDFARRTDCSSASQARETIMEMFKAEGALRPGIRILDVGGGPGNWAIPLSKTAGHVTVVEPSSKMVEILDKRIQEENIQNISVIQRRWEDVDVEAEGLSSQYDLVIAAMTPGVHNRTTLDTLIKASRKFCYMSSFSGLGRLTGVKELWEIVFNEILEENPGDIIYPFNLIYAMGYHPKLTFSFREKGQDMSEDEAQTYLLEFFLDYTDDSQEIREKVDAYIKTRSVNNRFSTRREICQGHMLWKVA